jgi:hypothetical protein
MREAHEPPTKEASMKTRPAFAALILGVVTGIAVPSSQSLAQSADQGTAASKSAKPNTNMTPQKHRAWRHQGGRHPHFGSRRVGGAQAARPSVQ